MASGQSEAPIVPLYEDAWYALTVRVHQVNGLGPEITAIKRLNQADGSVREFLDILAAARGEFRQHPTADFSRVRVSTIPDELLERKPDEAVIELISGRRASVSPY